MYNINIKHIEYKFLGISFKFLNLNSLKYIIYRRYFYPVYHNAYEHSIVSRRNFIKKKFLKNKKNIKIFKKLLWKISLFKILTGMNLDIAFMDYNITNRCTLRCQDCGSLMPFYPESEKWTITFEQFKKDLDKFLKNIHYVYRFKLIGGEPLMVKDLDLMFEYAVKKRKIKNIEITTNGTILFSDKMLKLLKKYRKKVFISISDYSSNRELKNLKYKQLIEQLNQNRVANQLLKYAWYERGEIYNRNKNKKELIFDLKKCWQKYCLTLFDGKFHICTRAVAIQRLTDYIIPEDEYIDIRITPPRQAKKKLRKMFLKDYFTACNFCIKPSKNRIPRAIQTSELQKIKNI